MNKSNNEQKLKQKELARIREAAARLAISADERDPYTQAEGRLYALPMIRARLEGNRDERDELASLGIEALREHSRSLVRLLSRQCGLRRRKSTRPSLPNWARA